MDFPQDVVRFVERYFHQKYIPAVYALLQTQVVRTPRVMRAVLYLSNGSFSLLELQVQECKVDIRTVLVLAEYVTGVGEQPFYMRDMSLPFTDELNLGEDCFRERPVAVNSVRQKTVGHPGRGSEEVPAAHHAHLVKRMFRLGHASYVVASKQPHPDTVRCYRSLGKVIGIVRLPLTFVLEQVAESIVVDVAL